jgi:ketosteroid isomerase-like protein
MDRSTPVRDVMLEFYDRLSANDVESFDRLVSSHPDTVVVGTAPGERVTDRAALRFGFETEGVRFEAGTDPIGYEEGALGWFLDEPRMFYPDGSSMRIRLTTILLREDDRWKLVHMHASAGVPDEEVVELQSRWGVT